MRMSLKLNLYITLKIIYINKSNQNIFCASVVITMTFFKLGVNFKATIITKKIDHGMYSSLLYFSSK